MSAAGKCWPSDPPDLTWIGWFVVPLSVDLTAKGILTEVILGRPVTILQFYYPIFRVLWGTDDKSLELLRETSLPFLK